MNMDLQEKKLYKARSFENFKNCAVSCSFESSFWIFVSTWQPVVVFIAEMDVIVFKVAKSIEATATNDVHNHNEWQLSADKLSTPAYLTFLYLCLKKSDNTVYQNTE